MHLSFNRYNHEEKQAKACNFTKGKNTPPWVFFKFLNCVK